MTKPSTLYERPFPSTRSGSLFNAFSYATKISPEAVAVFIAAHTRPDDLVLDPFAGTGTTGIGAALCARPTDRMLQLARERGIEPTWGPRRAILYEIGVLGSLISRTLTSPPDPTVFRAAAEDLLARTARALGKPYAASDIQGKAGEVRHVVWSEVVLCPACGEESKLADGILELEPIVRFARDFSCPRCGKETPARATPRVTEDWNDPILDRVVERRSRQPYLVFGRTGNRTWMRRATAADLTPIPLDPTQVPCFEIAWGDLYRSGYHEGISHLHHFYTERNLAVFSALWANTSEAPPDLDEALRFWLLSYNASHATIMTRVVAKSGHQGLVVTGAQPGVLYVSGLPVEKNILRGLQRKLKTICSAFDEMRATKPMVSVINSSSTDMDVETGSVDYVFTDPPFGDFIPYAELNQINEAWLGDVTDNALEVVISRSQAKSAVDYGQLMSQVFCEISRVTKSKAPCTVVFHAAKAEVWHQLVSAFTGAGFVASASSVLDKLQGSFKQAVSQVSVKGDPVVLLERALGDRPVSHGPTSVDPGKAVERALSLSDDLSVVDPARLFSIYISDCLARGVAIGIDADAFYKEVRGQQSK